MVLKYGERLLGSGEGSEVFNEGIAPNTGFELFWREDLFMYGHFKVSF